MVRDIQQLDDNELTTLLKEGDDRAFTEIYNRYWDKLYFIAYKLLRDAASAEEIVQEVFFTLWKKKDTLVILSLTQYLAAMARYAVYRHCAQEKQFKAKENALMLIKAGDIAEINIDNKILLEIILNLSNKLPEKCRLVFQYNKLQDISLAEVALQLNISQKTAEGHLTKALRTIRANLGNAMSDLLVFVVIESFFKR